MRCSQCGHENPFGNFFCGRCGTPLLQRPMAAQQNAEDSTRVAPDASPQSERHITGPSFLGLSEQSEEAHALDYLYEDEPRRHYGRLLLAILVLAGLGAFIAYQWRQRPDWYTALTNPFSRPTAQASVGGSSAGTAPAPAGTGAISNAATPQPAPAAPAASTPQSTTNSPTEPTAAPALSPQADDAQPDPVDATQETEEATVSRTTSPADEGGSLLTRGLAYLNGTGVPGNCEQALVYLNAAAQKGNARARSQLGGLYATGRCVPLDRARAYQYFTLALDAEHGRNVYIERNRSMLWSQMSDTERARARAAE